MPNIVKNTTITNLFDLIAPHSCRGCGRLGSVLCDCCKNNIVKNTIKICPHCKQLTKNHQCPNCTNLPPTYIAGYKSELIGELIQDYKYHSVRALARPLAEILGQILPNPNLNNTNPDNPNSKPNTSTIIVPLPTITRHIRERGFDHTYLIAKYLTKLRPHTNTEKLLLRAKNTIQVGTDRSTRIAQSQNAYTLAPNVQIDPTATYILLDDVWTTGSSMLAAINNLRQAGVTNILVAILALSGINQD